ncbi:MAG TPA: 16S rRNA (cytosine(1402)-N(4))-methyltransferase RsmH [Anaerolineales bacterium]|nr:16S rRNA (cytosine(1402)-N(4))-methyltransferase RsmH [Anaerolineales bacterium]
MAETNLGAGLPHRPVLYHEIIHALQPRRGGRYVDGTVGAGGHAWGVLQASAPDGILLGLDVDPQALELAGQRLAEFGERAILIQASYETLQAQLERLEWQTVEGVLLDLGLSSMQLDTAERGFSFRIDAPLDMRFDPRNPVSAADLVNQLPERELADLIYRYGEERRSRQVAHAIVQARPLHTTQELAQVVTRVVRGEPGQHPATRTFQALRIAVNRELEAVEAVLPQAVAALAPGGRLAVIAFHSLEDRIVKQFMRRESRDCICPPRQPVCTCGHTATLIEVTRRPIRPAESEVSENPRARSAVLRIAEKK